MTMVNKNLKFALAVTIALSCAPAGAVVIQNVVATNLSGADAGFTNASGTFQSKSTLSLIQSDATSCTTRFARSLLAYTDSSLGGGGSVGGGMTKYQISLNVLATPGEAWQLNLLNRRVGAITLVDRSPIGSAGGSTDTSTLAFSGSGALSGSLDLSSVNAGVGEPTIPGGAYVPFDQSASAQISGVGTGTAQSMTLQLTSGFPQVTWGSSSAGASDEAALRMGIALTSSFATTAGN